MDTSLDQRETRLTTKLLVFFVLLNFCIYLERGILPGASQAVLSFIKQISPTGNADTYFGLLQSAFIFGLSISSFIFGHLSEEYPKNLIIVFGLLVWNLAVLGTAISAHVGSYWLLFLCRFFSGCGEASFVSVIPPMICRLGDKRKGFWLSMFYAMIPVGTACGFGFGSILGEEIGWGASFGVIGILFIPFVVMIGTWLPPKSLEYNANDYNNGVLSWYSEIKLLLKTPTYVCLCAASAAYVGVAITITTFGSGLLIELNIFDSQSSSSLSLGLIAAAAGIFGTIIGGIIIDSKQIQTQILSLRNLIASNSHSEPFSFLGSPSHNEHFVNRALAVKCYARVAGFTSLAACLLLVISSLATNALSMLSLLFFGMLALFMTQTSLNLCIMWSVPEIRRSVAVGISILTMHLFGDVPGPVLFGLAKDQFAPVCLGDSTNCELERIFRLRVCLGCTYSFLLLMPYFLYMAQSYSFNSIYSFVIRLMHGDSWALDIFRGPQEENHPFFKNKQPNDNNNKVQTIMEKDSNFT